MNESDGVRSPLMLKLRCYIHKRVCVLEEYYNVKLGTQQGNFRIDVFFAFVCYQYLWTPKVGYEFFQ